MMTPGIAELSTFWIDVECEDRPGILSDVSRLITSHNMSIEVCAAILSVHQG